MSEVKGLLALLAMSMAAEPSPGLYHVHPRGRKEPVYKNCMNCGKEHTHNNTCCSAECFKMMMKADK